MSLDHDPAPTPVLRVNLRSDDRAALAGLTAELASRYDSVEAGEFQREARIYADELPRWLRRTVGGFRLTEPSGVLLISGLEIDDAALGRTPAHWKDRAPAPQTLPHDLAFYLIACLLGEPIGWATQQDGRIMHDVFPIEQHASEQIGWSSAEVLVWHTEDAFHPLRTDYLGLLCLRNPDGVATTLADIRDVRLGAATRDVLAEERFYILPDDSHRAANQLEADDDEARAALRRRSSRQVDRALTAPQPVAVLFGPPEAPYLRIDPAYMNPMRDKLDTAARAALDDVCAGLDAVLRELVLRPGDMCFIDNYRVVHGRQSFRARFDGTDRWLRRLNLARDLRRSRALRLTPDSRVIY
ncbi:MAG: TauD/TfdA family dioxygenase [Streptosporangiaceae bacterium]|nr:TauD/TfdA family dioxygenase [Streptosporangiaceae bacterium]